MDQNIMKISYHETGHAVMALFCRQEIQKLSLRGMDSPIGTDKYHGFMKLKSKDTNSKFTVEKAIHKIMISLGGYASEILFSGGSVNIGGDDLTVAAKTAEDMLQVSEFRDWVAGLPKPSSVALDVIENPLVRAYIEYMINSSVETLSPYKHLIEAIANELYIKSEMTGEEVSSIFNSFVKVNPNEGST